MGVTAAASSVFQACLEAGVLDSARGATEEVADAHEAAASAGLDDWLARAAALARYLPSATFPAVAQALAQTQQRLASAAAAGSDPSEALEQLVWLVRLAGHCLADSGSGETPLLPLTLATHSSSQDARFQVIGMRVMVIVISGIGVMVISFISPAAPAMQPYSTS
ncbi:importin N-terminal domain-containing protein [Haematococcus lacustris]|uniref:Importin N-terminal domain-containing protein n=1 Tax=Haematococcus lacustris TaxID=44745 RepID=A0A699ZG01_HAELA|nr:importin N-terminal domain-containing protein [Haematococcus lacustris]